MPKVDLSSNKAASKEWQTFTFCEPDEPEKEYVFKLRPLSEMERLGMRAFAERLAARYLTGGYVDVSGDWRDKPEILALIRTEDGKEYAAEVSEDAMATIARLERMQGIKREVTDDTPRPDAYIAHELAVIAETAPTVWENLKMAAVKVQQGAAKKKASGADSAGTSSTPGSEAGSDISASGSL